MQRLSWPPKHQSFAGFALYFDANVDEESQKYLSRDILELGGTVFDKIQPPACID